VLPVVSAFSSSILMTILNFVSRSLGELCCASQLLLLFLLPAPDLSCRSAFPLDSTSAITALLRHVDYFRVVRHTTIGTADYASRVPRLIVHTQ
jgi:hypothetical protein